MESTTVYIPIDRRQAIARGEELPDRTSGAALFADISGFTPFTTTLLDELGPKRGPEELTRQLNLVYDALITEVHRYGGSVMIFSGDAITCWLDSDNGLRAIACGLAMQRAMKQFSTIKTPAGNTVSLGIKVAIATGPIQRFQAGDPQIQYIDALAGATLERMAEAEHHAQTGEVVADAATIAGLVDDVEIAIWREHDQTGDRFAVVSGLKTPPPTFAWPQLSDNALNSQAQSWLLPPVYERLRSGQGRFLAELRPTLALFLRFSGIDYDQDEAAGRKLDTYIRWVQNVLARYEAYLLQLTIGDKGSYLYAAFGAPVAHEDDAERAMSAALELRHPPASIDFIDLPQIGISQGQMLTGAYGGTTRCTYGVLGDEVNMAARLMQAAKPGQVLVSRAAQQFAKDDFIWSELPPLKVKGKIDLVTAFSLEGQQKRRAIHLREPEYTLPMVGREAELALVAEKMDQVLAGHGQLIAITAEAGMGKSRMVAEIIRVAGNRGLTGYGGECQSFGTNISYLVWQPIWQGLFGIDPAWEVDAQIKEMDKQLTAIDPALAPRLPLLGTVLNLPIPDNELTRSFDAKLRKSSLESLLLECLRAKSKQTPLLLVLEDCHWLDPLSHDLLEIIARGIVDLPVLLILNYRPPDIERLQAPRVSQLAHFTEIQLDDFSLEDAQQLITLKIDQLFGTQSELSSNLVEQITTRAGGNPFYIEELLNYLQDQGFDPHNRKMLDQIDLPTSLHSLILSRIDQLTESQKSTLKVASVIGRLFRAAWLWGISPELGEVDRIKTNLENLSRLDLTPMDTPEPELAYLFRHVITQEVAYESLPYATRATLHNQLGLYIEKTYANKLALYIDLLAFHFDRSDNEAKKREYLVKAGEAAQADYANQAAIDYYQRVLPLLSSKEQVTVTRKLGEVLQLVGEWHDADKMYRQALAVAEEINDQAAQAWCQIAIGELFRLQGMYPEASEWLANAQETFQALNDQAGVGRSLHLEGNLAAQQGDFDTAQTRWENGLAIRRQLNDKAGVADLISNLGFIAQYQSDFEKARTLNEEALALRYELADKKAIANSLNNLGNVYLDKGELMAAQTQLEVALGLQREIGDRWAVANALNNLANVIRAQGDYDTAQTMYVESLTTNWELGDKWAIAYLLEDMGGLAALQDQAERALLLVGAASALRKTINAPLPPAEQEKLDKILESSRQSLGEDVAAKIETDGKAMSLEQAIDEALQKNSIQ